jgi:dCTP deaminase
MAEQHKMIEPFEKEQVKQTGDTRLISYGTSSYGYDVRCANHFKVFTNINSTIVDPKAFDEQNFVTTESDVCIIPPNSFALAHTVEYFRIPREVLVVCLGKSTYARCFRGDTRVALVDGSSPTLEEMARRAELGEDFWGYSIGLHGQLIVTRFEAPRFIGTDNLLEITLDNNEKIHCTADHQFMLRDGSMCQAHELRPATSLMPLYRQVARGYEMVYQPLNGHLIPTHRLADNWNLRHGIYRDEANTHRHHLDHDRRNKRPWNIVCMDAAEHIRHHNQDNYGEAFDPDEHSASIKEALARAAQDPHWLEAYQRLQKERAVSFWHDDKYAEQRTAKGKHQKHNHKVTAVKEIPGTHDVYCLTVPEAGNFALEAGVFVHNCGIIVNVTPLEPEWEGHVTLEFSNTTPLPAKIYANEGVAQLLFLGADEVCTTSYRDRQGKYQGQTGVTLPKA